MNTPLKIHGGKHYLAPKIAAMMPPHVHYVEPYFGGGSVLLARPADLIEGHSEVVNDVDGDLMNFWLHLRDEYSFMRLQRELEATPFSQQTWQDAYAERFRQDRWSSLDRAYQFFILCRQSLSGRRDAFAPRSRTRTRRGMNEQVSAWLAAIEGLPEVHERIKRVAILRDQADRVIRAEDGAGTLFYCDPPYLHQTRATTGEYRFEMTDKQHEELLGLLASIKGKFMLSGYDSELYNDFEQTYGWHRTEFDLPNNAAAGKAKRRMIECVWTNFRPDERVEPTR